MWLVDSGAQYEMCWNCLLFCFLRKGTCWQKALVLLQKMKIRGPEPDLVAFLAFGDIWSFFLEASSGFMSQCITVRWSRDWSLSFQERSKVSYTSAMAACEKAKIGFWSTALWSRSKGPKIVKAANWRHSCGARPVNGRKPWNCFVRRRIPRWHRIWWCFFSWKLHMIQKMYNHEVGVWWYVYWNIREEPCNNSFILSRERTPLYFWMYDATHLVASCLSFCISASVLDWLDHPGPLFMFTLFADHWLSQVYFGEEVGARDV